MKLCFDSIEEVKDFVGSLKGTRGGKGGKGDETEMPSVTGQAPAPLMPQAQFTPPGQQQQPTGPFGDPAVTALAGRIAARIDSAIASGQPADQALAWFRGQCGAEASAATMEQIKSIFLPKMAVAGLENIAKLMNA